MQDDFGDGGRESRRARFVIVTKDGGFDGLLSYVRSLGYEALKVVTIAEVLDAEPRPKGKAKVDIMPKLVTNFREHPKALPATRAALERHVSTALGAKAAPSGVQEVITAMERAGIITITDKKVEYSLPSE